MNCDRYRGQLSEYLEGTLEPALSVELARHLGACGRCRAEATALQRTMSLLEALPVVEPPAEGIQEVLRRVHAADVRHSRALTSRGLEGFVRWLRGLSPARLAFGAGLATIALTGITMVTSTSHVAMNLNPFREVPAARTAATPIPAVPEIAVAYEPAVAGAQPVILRVSAPSVLPDATIDVVGSSRWSVEPTRLTPGTTLEVPLRLPAESTGEVLRVTIRSAARTLRFEYLVAVPLAARRAAPVTLSFSYLPLEAALQQLVFFLDQPLVVSGAPEGTVQLSAHEQPVRVCLATLAQQLGATLTEEQGAYRLQVR